VRDGDSVTAPAVGQKIENLGHFGHNRIMDRPLG